MRSNVFLVRHLDFSRRVEFVQLFFLDLSQQFRFVQKILRSLFVDIFAIGIRDVKQQLYLSLNSARIFHQFLLTEYLHKYGAEVYVPEQFCTDQTIFHLTSLVHSHRLRLVMTLFSLFTSCLVSFLGFFW